MTINPKLQ